MLSHKLSVLVLLCSLGMDYIQNTASNSSSIVSCLFAATEMCLSYCCLVAVPSCSTILTSNHHVTICTYHECIKVHFITNSQSSFIVPIIQMPRSELFILINKCDYKACTALHHILHNNQTIITFCVQNLGMRIF